MSIYIYIYIYIKYNNKTKSLKRKPVIQVSTRFTFVRKTFQKLTMAKMSKFSRKI